MEDRIRILHIIKSLGRGGAEMLLPETLKLHNKARYEFHYLYFLPWKDQMVADIHNAGGKVTCIPANNNIALILQTRRVVAYIREHRIQLIHAHLPWAGIVARIAGRITGVPVIYTEHNKQERYHIATRTMNLASMNWLSALVCVSEDVAQSVRKHKRNLRVPLHVVLNGVNTDHFAPGLESGQAVREKFHIPADAPVIGTVAVFRFQKRLEVWLQTAARIHQQLPNARFIIVGDGPLKAELLAEMKRLNLNGIVHFAGLQTEVRPYLAAFDLYMMSSIFEGLPIALLEAMSMGCAVVSTRAGGIGEVITHAQNGLLCDVNETDQLPDLAFSLLCDNEKRRALAKEARNSILRSFSMEKMVRQLELLYESQLRIR